jgi:hypothetical protein
MSNRPHLVFVKGPQDGQRVSLQGERVVAGRSTDVQLPLTEHYVSRQQMQFTRTPDGWIMENLSSNGTVVNGRRYKADKQILLGTGDLLGVGLETEILFVGEGDDPKEALAKYRESLPAVEPKPQPAEPMAAPIPDGPPEGELPPPPEEESEPATESIEALSTEQVQTQERKAKMKRYLVFAGLSVAMTVGVIALGSLRGPATPTVLWGGPVRLTGMEIGKAIEKVPENITPGATQAASELQLANQFYLNHILEGQLYQCIRHYKLYLAYRGRPVFEHGEDERWYRAALNGDGQGEPGLIRLASGMYDRACEYETGQRWADALPLFEKLIKMIPAETDDPTYDSLLKNIIDHRKFVELKMTTKK